MSAYFSPEISSVASTHESFPGEKMAQRGANEMTPSLSRRSSLHVGSTVDTHLFELEPQHGDERRRLNLDARVVLVAYSHKSVSSSCSALSFRHAPWNSALLGHTRCFTVNKVEPLVPSSSSVLASHLPVAGL